MLVCTGNGFVNSLPAVTVGRPILLVDKSGYQFAVDYAESNGTKKAVALGGDALIPDSVVIKMI